MRIVGILANFSDNVKSRPIENYIYCKICKNVFIALKKNGLKLNALKLKKSVLNKSKALCCLY